MDIASAKTKISKLKDPRIQEVADLLLNLDLELIACGDETKIFKNGNEIGQLDLIYKDDDVDRYFLFEVSTLHRNVTAKINSFFSRWSNPENLKLIKEKFSISPRFQINRVFFELTKNEIPASVKHNLSDGNNSVLLNYDLKYFLDAYEKIGKWAKNDLFNFLKIRPKHPRPISEINALRFYLGDICAYLYLDRVDRILKYCYIFRRIKNDKGYQRILEKKKIGNIAKRIRTGSLMAFPNTILISSADNFTFCDHPADSERIPQPVKIKIPDYYCACRVIDGQHRLFGFANLDAHIQESYYLPIIALEKIELGKEIKTFIDINWNQKKIDRNLLLTLKADFDWDKNLYKREYYEKQAVLVVKKLRQDGPLKGKIFILEALEIRKGKITLNTLVSAIIGNNFIGGKLHLFQQEDDDIETPFQKINKVFLLLLKHLPEYSRDTSSFFLSNKGLRMLFRFIQIFVRNKIKGNIDCSYEDLIIDLKNIFNDKFVEELEVYYGEGGANKAADMVYTSLKEKFEKRYENVITNLNKI